MPDTKRTLTAADFPGEVNLNETDLYLRQKAYDAGELTLSEPEKVAE